MLLVLAHIHVHYKWSRISATITRTWLYFVLQKSCHFTSQINNVINCLKTGHSGIVRMKCYSGSLDEWKKLNIKYVLPVNNINPDFILEHYILGSVMLSHGKGYIFVTLDLLKENCYLRSWVNHRTHNNLVHLINKSCSINVVVGKKGVLNLYGP